MIAKLRQADVLIAQGQSVADVIRSLGVTEVTYDRWRKEFGGLKTDQGGLLLRLVQGQISGLQLGATGSVYTRHTVETVARTGSRPAIEFFYGARETIVVDAA